MAQLNIITLTVACKKSCFVLISRLVWAADKLLNMIWTTCWIQFMGVTINRSSTVLFVRCWLALYFLVDLLKSHVSTVLRLIFGSREGLINTPRLWGVLAQGRRLFDPLVLNPTQIPLLYEYIFIIYILLSSINIILLSCPEMMPIQYLN